MDHMPLILSHMQGCSETTSFLQGCSPSQYANGWCDSMVCWVENNIVRYWAAFLLLDDAQYHVFENKVVIAQCFIPARW